MTGLLKCIQPQTIPTIVMEIGLLVTGRVADGSIAPNNTAYICAKIKEDIDKTSQVYMLCRPTYCNYTTKQKPEHG